MAPKTMVITGSSNCFLPIQCPISTNADSLSIRLFWRNWKVFRTEISGISMRKILKLTSMIIFLRFHLRSTQMLFINNMSESKRNATPLLRAWNYCKISITRHTKSQNLNDSGLVVVFAQFIGARCWVEKADVEQHWQAMLQLVSDQQYYCPLGSHLY